MTAHGRGRARQIAAAAASYGEEEEEEEERQEQRPLKKAAHGRGRARQIAAAAASYGEEEEEELHMVADRHPVPVAAPAPRNARGVVAAIGHAEHRHGALPAPQVLPREEIPDQPYLADGGGSKSKDDGTEAARKAM